MTIFRAIAAIAVASALATPLAAQDAPASPSDEAGTVGPDRTAPTMLESPARQLVFRRITPEVARRLDLQAVPTPPAYGISIGQYWDCAPVTSPFGPTGLTTCRLTLVVCDDEGGCVEL